jgi:hypothetical protein
MSSIKRSYSKLSIYIFLFTLSLFFIKINSQVVCSEDELIRELQEDLDDNGQLDCLRRSKSPLEAEEDSVQREMRVAAEWNGDCSFEADTDRPNNWIQQLKNNYALTKGLVDVNGEPVEVDFDDQADMCEIIRALIANGKFPKIGESLKNIDDSFLDEVDCPGAEGQTEICAATGGSFADKKGWLILLDGQSLRIKDTPRYILSTNNGDGRQ